MRILEYRFYQYCPCHNTGKLVLSSIFQYFHITILEYQYCQNNNTGKPVLSKQQYWKTSIVKVTILEYQYRHIYNTGIPVLLLLNTGISVLLLWQYWYPIIVKTIMKENNTGKPVQIIIHIYILTFYICFIIVFYFVYL